jgi:hypothetical protein
MDPLASAAIRTVGAAAKAALGHYRPVGVARVGSAEDRAQSYRRLLDAVAYVVDTQILYFYRRRDAEAARGVWSWRRRAQFAALREDAWRTYTQAQHEVHAALLGVRLCAPVQVLDRAEALIDAVPRVYHLGTDKTLPESDYLAAHDSCNQAKCDYLEAARQDLSYNPRPWHLLRRYRERNHHRLAARLESG